jgi:hypothetical protein
MLSNPMMEKIAVFVEGQAELIFTRDLIAKNFSWDVSFECFCLTGFSLSRADFEYKNPTSEYHFQIVNVGNDERVLKYILDNEEKLYDVGFTRIIGLRDMYSTRYKNFVLKPNEIDFSLNKQFIKNDNEIIEKNAKEKNRISYCFSVMEFETWLLGMPNIFIKKKSSLLLNEINQNLKVDITIVDPEKMFFKSADVVSQILSIKSDGYDKHKSEVEALVSFIEIEDLKGLYQADKCCSFNSYIDALLPKNYNLIAQ